MEVDKGGPVGGLVWELGFIARGCGLEFRGCFVIRKYAPQ